MSVIEATTSNMASYTYIFDGELIIHIPRQYMTDNPTHISLNKPFKVTIQHNVQTQIIKYLLINALIFLEKIQII